MIPGGREIIIANEKPSAIMTNSALIFRLEIFLIALVTIPIFDRLVIATSGVVAFINVTTIVVANLGEQQRIVFSFFLIIGQSG